MLPMSYAELTPEARMNELRKLLQQLRDYTKHEEECGNAVSNLRRRSQSHSVILKNLEKRGSLTRLELDRWQKIKSDYHSELPEMF